MIKIINPCKCEVYTRYGKETRMENAFCKIEINEENGTLSITGVIGPLSSGNAKGSAGQCINEIRTGEPTEEWTDEMLQKFCDIWDEWHLNDMRAYCSHMKELGWTKHFNEEIKVSKWTITKEAYNAKRNAENRALRCLKEGTPFYPTKDEIAYANMPYEITTYNGEEPSYNQSVYKESYKLKEKDCLGNSNTTKKTRGWISYKDHPLGFLGRPCPVCGYAYGTSWLKEDLPQDVIDFLESLPASKITPAWV